MTLFPGIRAVAMLRRISRALEEANELKRQEMAVLFPDWGRKVGLRRSPKAVEFSVADQVERNERWRRMQEGEIE